MTAYLKTLTYHVSGEDHPPGEGGLGAQIVLTIPFVPDGVVPANTGGWPVTTDTTPWDQLAQAVADTADANGWTGSNSGSVSITKYIETTEQVQGNED